MTDARTRLLDAAEQLLTASPDSDIAIRDVCRIAGVGLPVLYRQFGDKAGLLKAVVDHGFDRYLEVKRHAKPSANPVEDLLAGWDSHIEFAVSHPAVYRLMLSPTFDQVPRAASELMRILRAALERAAAAGLLVVDIDLATQQIMSAAIGVSLGLVVQPENFRDPTLSRQVRDAIHRDLFIPGAFSHSPRAPATIASAANQLGALIGEQASLPLTDPEQALLRQWLRTLAGDSPTKLMSGDAHL
ncbi:AcrR family transcriptional regulator [Nakamurella sp. UYEF19]|uniref:TetR/AcrR family transcriptional regulator n=1 Tax=Nakamurella sp. UYEF19 TaxID=1756392 RepID=UPI0033915F26